MPEYRANHPSEMELAHPGEILREEGRFCGNGVAFWLRLQSAHDLARGAKAAGRITQDPRARRGVIRLPAC